MKTAFKSLLLIASLSLMQCQRLFTPKDGVKCVMTNFENEIENNQNLAFTFNKDMVKSDSLLDVWLDDELIKISPGVKGRCKWTTKRELIFSPLTEFPSATDFKAVISDKVTKDAPVTIRLLGKTAYEFHTSFLTIIGSHSYWRPDKNNADKILLQTDVKFNMPVQPSKVADLLEAKINGDKSDFTIKNTRPSKVISILFSNPKSTNEKTVVNLKLKKIGKNMQEDEFTDKSKVAAIQKLELGKIDAVHNGINGTLFIATSQPVKETKLKEAVKIEPEVNFNVTADDQGIMITSEEFNADQQYEVYINESISGIFGGKLNDDYVEDAAFGDLSPMIRFQQEKAEYLGAKGSKNVALTITKTDKIKVSVYKVFQNNLYAFKNRGKDWGYNDIYNEATGSYDYNDYQYYDIENMGELLYEKKINVSNLKDYGPNAKLLKLDLNDQLKEFKGIYVVKVEDNDKIWVQDSKIIALSDIGLIVKQDKSAVHVFANSIKTTEPIKHAEISIISTSNQELGKVKTDGDGYAHFVIPATYKNIGFKVGMVTAVHDTDYNYILLDGKEVDNSRYDVGGKYLNASNYDAYIYAERDIYRPGETMHLNTIVRTNTWDLPGEMPVKIKIYAPNGKEFYNAKNVLNEQGAVADDIALSASAMTGTYVYQIYSGNDILLASKNMLVEEFMPDRIKVDLKTDKEEYRPNEAVNISINAMNYFGPPAANRNYEVNFSLEKASFASKEFKQYTFDVSKAAEYLSVNANGITDANGNASAAFNIPAEYASTGLLNGRAFVTVFDETGRPVNRLKTFNVYTQDTFYGIKTDNDYFSTKSLIKIPVVALDKKGVALTSAKANVKMIKRTWETVLQKNNGVLSYVSQQKEEVVENKNILIRGANSYFAFSADESGEYEMRISNPGNESYVSFNFWAYGWGDTYANSFEVNNEGKIDITLDKEKYLCGEKAKVLLKMPFDGKVLISIERDSLIEHFYIDSKNKAAEFELKLKEVHVPNVYVSAVLIKPNVNDGMPLTIAYGFQPVLVENPDNKIPIDIQCATESRSKTKQVIKIKSKPNTEMTIAVVDEGILALKNQKSPSPYDYFYSKRALEVSLFSIYPYLFPELTALGGGFDDIGKRVNPMTNKRVKLVSLWSGIIKTNALGNAEFPIYIPQFSGSLRVMAVAYNGKRFGNADKNITVADPIVISTGIPRFVSPGDELTVPVTVSNTTKNNAQAIVSVQSFGVLQNKVNGEMTTDITAKSEKQLDFSVITKEMTGEGKVVVTVKSMNETFSDTTYINSRPNTSYRKYSGSSTVDGGKSATVSFAGNMPMMFHQNKLVVGNSPLIQFGKNLQYLVQYPYGCIEQTISSAFPQLYYTDLAKNLNEVSGQENNAVSNVQFAIDKVQSMQLSSGAMAYWPGGSYDTWWGTVYAGHFLLEAQKAGYNVNPKVLNKLFDYLQNRMKIKEVEWMYYADGRKREVIKAEVPYSLYVLAMADEVKGSTLNYYKSNKELLTQSGQYLLACAYAMQGDKKKFYELLPKGYVNENADPKFSGNFYSDFRDMALVLNTLLETDPQNTQINYMAKQVSQKLLQSTYLNTQENVFGILAMGKIARNANKSTVTASIMSNGKEIAKFDGKNVVNITSAQIVNNNIAIKTNGSGKLYYFWETEGLPTQADNKEEDNFLEVRRTYKDRYGKVFNNYFNQNDLVVVEISIRSTNGIEVPNVAITDLLPAGFEIENARITDIPQLEWMKQGATPDYKDIRDDRMNIMVTATPYIQKYYYLCRAVSLGMFNVGPIAADAMYRGEYHSYHGAGKISIGRKTVM